MFWTVAVCAQQQGLGGIGGIGGLAGYQSNNSRFVITTNQLPDAPANVAYSQAITSVNGTNPLTWTVMLGSLPPGLTLNSSTGVISGTPTTIGNYPFTILATDSSSPTAKTATKDLSIAVTCSPLQITSQSPLPPASVGSADNYQFQSLGGFGTINWTNPGGGIPPGTSLSLGGLLSGNPTTAGQYNFNIKATDSCPTPQVVTQPFSQQVNNTLTITTNSPLPNGTRGSPYSVQMSASGGTSPYTWQLLIGTLPAGLNLSSGGVISGTPLNAETQTVTIQVTDSIGAKNNKQFQITIICPPLTITSTTLPVGSQGQPYFYQLQSQGGSGTVTWSLAPGSVIDPGLTLSPSGLISGTPTSPNTYTPIIQATDSCTPTPQTVPQQFTLTIVPQLTITTNTLPNGTQGVSYNATVVAQGGLPPYQWTVPSGTVPTGAIDMLDWELMTLPDRNNYHMDGGANPTYSVLQGGVSWNIKAAAGSPWDIRVYDDQYIYFWITENNDSDQQAACQAAGYAACFVDPFAYKQAVSPRPSTPRYFVLGSPDVVITLPGPNPGIRTTNCGADNQPLRNLGNVAFVLHDAGTTNNWGGDVGNAYTLILSYYHGINSLTQPFQGGSVETFYFAKPFGRFKWTNADWNGSAYIISQTTNNNHKVLGGAPTPNYGCKVSNLPQAGILPTGVPITSAPSLNLVDSTGVIKGTPNSQGTSIFNVQVEDSLGTITQKQLSITTVCPALTLTSTSPLPQGTINQPYSYTFTSTGGAVPNTWHLLNGTLPPGLSLSLGGVLSGTPNQTGTFNFVVQVLDSCAPQQQSAQKSFTLAIAANSGPITITTTSPLPQGTELVAYSDQLTATGGTPPYTWSVAAGALCTGLTQNAAGLVSGTPTQAQTCNWTARVTDSIAGTTTKALALTIVCPPLSITSTSPLPPATVGQFYSFQFASSGGIPAIAWGATGVPPGLTLSVTGLLSGTPTVAATSTINVSATDHCQPTPQTAGPTGFSLTVNPAIAPVQITSTSPLPQGTEGQNYNNQLTASGGQPPYTWSITSGALQSGLNLSTSGQITGTPTTASTSAPTYKVTDSVGGFDTRVLSLTTVCPAFAVTSQSPLPPATQNQPYQFQFTSTGGIAPITWTATGVPAGLSLNSATGLLSGTPTGTGTFTINVTATDSCAPTPQAVGPTGFSLTINPAPQPLQINTPSPLPAGTQNVFYSTTLTATGGTPPYGSWTVTVGTLPTGLTLHSATGVIDGTPTVLGTSSFTVQVTDAFPNNATKAFQLTINAASTADQRFCNTNETTTITGQFDGPAQQIQTCTRRSVADTPASGPTKTVCASGCDFTTIQAAINAASCGWIITVKAATAGVQNTYAAYTIPGTMNCSATNWLIIETDQLTNLPIEGTRVSPAFVGIPSLHVPCPSGTLTECGRPTYSQPAVPGIYMPKIIASNNVEVIQSGASHIRHIGLEFTTTNGVNAANIVSVTGANHIVWDRILCHGGNSPNWQDRDTVTRCMSWTASQYMAVVDSYMGDFHCLANASCADSHTILYGGNSANAEGPFTSVNNFLEAAGESCGFTGGGGSTTLTILTPHDLELRRNHCFKPQFWYPKSSSYFGTQFQVKNNLEMKNIDRMLSQGNIFDTTYIGTADQKGFQAVYGAKNQANAFGGTAASDGAGTITWKTGTQFQNNQTSPKCAIPNQCRFRYNGITYRTQTFIDATHVKVCCGPVANPVPPATASASYLAFLPGLNPNAQVSNVTSNLNRYTHSANGLQLFVVASDGGDFAKGTFNLSFSNEIIDDVDGNAWSTTNGACCAWSDIYQISNGATLSQGNLHDISIRHVTGLSRLSASSTGFGPGIAFVDQTAAGSTIGNLKIFDNIFAAGIPRDVKGVCTGGTDATSVLNCIGSIGGTGSASYCFDHNILATTTATSGAVTGTSNNPPYPTPPATGSPNCTFPLTGNQLPASYNAIQFTNLNGAIGGNYQLLGSSPYHNAASDGTDPGANVSAVNAATSGVN